MIKKARWAVKEAKLRVNYMTSTTCIFCKIVKGKMKTKLIKETNKAIAFNDINPVADTHVLIVPKKHIESVATIDQKSGDDVIAMFKLAAKIANSRNLNAYRLSFNAGKYQHVEHLHMHLLAGSKIQWSKL